MEQIIKTIENLFVDSLSETLVSAVFTLLAAYIGWKLIRHWICRWKPANEKSILKITKIAIKTLTVLLLLSLFKGFKNMITLIFTGSGIFAIIVGLAATEAFGNLISGAMILIFKPFKIGDLVKVNSAISGTVHEITLRHTVIKTLENTDIIIPNSEMNKLTLENISAATLKGNFLVVEVSYESNLEKAIQIMTETIMQHPDFIDGRSEEDKRNNVSPVTVSCTSFNASGIELKAKVYSKSHAVGFAMLSDIRLTLKKRFDEEGIEIPYPHVTITQKS